MSRSFGVTIALLAASFAGCRQGAAFPTSQKKDVPVREVFVLPPGYSGPFIAIYGQKGGAEPTWSGDTAMFKVPASGILRISYMEPPSTTLASHVYADRIRQPLTNYPTCADMWERVPDTRMGVCWLDFVVGTGSSPDHVIAVITNRNDLPREFERTTSVYDSVMLGGRGLGRREWVEPANSKRKRAE
jgi:hypothetical protein